MTSSIRSITSAALTVLLIGILCVVGGLALPFKYAGSVGAAWLPLLIGILLIVCAIAFWITELRAKESITWTDRQGWLTIGAVFGSFIIFLVVADLTFFALGAFVFIILFLSSINTYSIVKRLIVAAVSAVSIHVVFAMLLHVPLPGAWL